MEWPHTGIVLCSFWGQGRVHTHRTWSSPQPLLFPRPPPPTLPQLWCPGFCLFEVRNMVGAFSDLCCPAPHCDNGLCDGQSPKDGKLILRSSLFQVLNLFPNMPAVCFLLVCLFVSLSRIIWWLLFCAFPRLYILSIWELILIYNESRVLWKD